MEYQCSYCLQTKDEMLFLRRARKKNAKVRKCKSCYRRECSKGSAEARHLRKNVSMQKAEIMAILNKTMFFLPPETRLRICERAMVKKWTLEAVLNLHKSPIPLEYTRVPKT